MAKLKRYVHVTELGEDGKPTGRAQWFGPEHTVPDWALPYITNPKVWADAPEVKPAEVPVPYEVKPPPRGGAGSGRSEWAAYAIVKGVEVTEDLKSRDDIIAALELAGVPTD
jgi:hypothetical protein